MYFYVFMFFFCEMVLIWLFNVWFVISLVLFIDVVFCFVLFRYDDGINGFCVVVVFIDVIIL